MANMLQLGLRASEVSNTISVMSSLTRISSSGLFWQWHSLATWSQQRLLETHRWSTSTCLWQSLRCCRWSIWSPSASRSSSPCTSSFQLAWIWSMSSFSLSQPSQHQLSSVLILAATAYVSQLRSQSRTNFFRIILDRTTSQMDRTTQLPDAERLKLQLHSSGSDSSPSLEVCSWLWHHLVASTWEDQEEVQSWVRFRRLMKNNLKKIRNRKVHKVQGQCLSMTCLPTTSFELQQWNNQPEIPLIRVGVLEMQALSQHQRWCFEYDYESVWVMNRRRQYHSWIVINVYTTKELNRLLSWLLMIMSQCSHRDIRQGWRCWKTASFPFPNFNFSARLLITSRSSAALLKSKHVHLTSTMSLKAPTRHIPNNELDPGWEQSFPYSILTTHCRTINLMIYKPWHTCENTSSQNLHPSRKAMSSWGRAMSTLQNTVEQRLMQSISQSTSLQADQSPPTY